MSVIVFVCGGKQKWEKGREFDQRGGNERGGNIKQSEGDYTIDKRRDAEGGEDFGMGKREGEREWWKDRKRPPQSHERRTVAGEIKKVERERERPPYSENQREGCRFQRLFLSQHSSP